MHFFEKLDHFDFDLEDADGETPLFYATSRKMFDMVHFLVKKGARLHHTSIKNKWSPVYIAATLGTVQILNYFLELGCDPNQQTNMKRTALTKTCWMGRIDTLTVLLKHPKIMINHKANGKRTALHMAVWGQYGGRHGKKMGSNPHDSPEAAKMLLEAGANPNATDDRGKTPLIVACQTGAQQSIPIMLDYGADLNHVTDLGSTALHTAIYFGTIECIEPLIWHQYKEGQPV